MRNECQWRVFIGLWERIDREWEMNADDVCLFVCISLFVQSVNSLFSRAGIFPVHLIWFIFEGIRFIREKKTKERMDVRKRKKVRERESGCWQEKCNLLSWSSSVGFFWKGNDCKQTKDLQLDCCYNLLIPFPQRLSFLSLSLYVIVSILRLSSFFSFIVSILKLCKCNQQVSWTQINHKHHLFFFFLFHVQIQVLIMNLFFFLLITAYKMTTKTRVFRHSSQEKKEYIKAFLKSISVNK